MKASIGVLATLALAGFLASCAGTPEPPPSTGQGSGPRFVLSLEPGPAYAFRMKAFPVSYTVWPQVAAWVEKPDGTFIDTIYATARGSAGTWRMAPKEGRPEALPVWYHLRREGADAVSAATTKDSTVTYGSALAGRLPPGDYVVKLETNRSYDWNATYTKDSAGVSGQPSLVYAATIRVGSGRTEALFAPVGRGSVDGSDGLVRPDLAGIDSALTLFSSMKVVYESE